MSSSTKAIPDYRAMLKSEYLRRRRKSPAYSMKAFAVDLGLSQPFLSLLFKERTHISLARAKGLMPKLKWSSVEKRRFLTLVEASSARYRPARENAMTRFFAKEKRKAFDVSILDRLTWRHFALLEIAKTRQFTGATKDFAGAFGLVDGELDEALALLVQCGLLKGSDGTWAPNFEDNEVTSAVPHAAIQRFHLDLVQRASRVFESPKVGERQLDSLVFAFDKERLPEVKRYIFEFVQNFDGRFSKGTPDSVYCLATQFFQLDV